MVLLCTCLFTLKDTLLYGFFKSFFSLLIHQEIIQEKHGFPAGVAAVSLWSALGVECDSKVPHVHSVSPFVSDIMRAFFSTQSSTMRSREGLYLSKSWRTKSAVD
ncbi:MAG: hypothetical protein QOH49_1810 [Acidobacteriota bacterium]|nr:hypothetical protein [Acidobacteriota bacterium]